MKVKKFLATVLLATVAVAIPAGAASAAPKAKVPAKSTYVVSVVDTGAKATGLANAVKKNPNYVADGAGGYVRDLTPGQAKAFAAKGKVTVAPATR